MAHYITDELKGALKIYLERTPKMEQGREHEFTAAERREYIAAFTEVHTAFTKLTDGLLHTNRLYLYAPDRESLRQECILHLMSKVPNFNLELRPFPYFNMVARNFLLFHKERNKRRSRLFQKLTIGGEDAGDHLMDKAMLEVTIPDFMSGQQKLCETADQQLIKQEEITATILFFKEERGRMKQKGGGKLAQCKLTVLDAMLTLVDRSDSSLVEHKQDLHKVLLELCVDEKFSRRAVTVAIRSLRRDLKEGWVVEQEAAE